MGSPAIRVMECEMVGQGHPGKMDLLRWVSGRLDGLREQRVLAHTRGCPRCRRRLVALIHAHRVLDVGGHFWRSRGRRLGTVTATVLVSIAIAWGAWAVRDGIVGAPRPTPQQVAPDDPAERLVTSAGPRRLSLREAEELILNATVVRRFAGVLKPAGSGADARESDMLIEALDAVIAGDADGAVAAFVAPPRTARGALVFGLSLYLANAEVEQAEAFIARGLEGGDITSLVSVGHWVLGQLCLGRRDWDGAREHWQMAADSGPSAFATLADVALEELERLRTGPTR